MSTRGPYLESGESIVLTTDRISVDNVTFDAILTTRRLILIDNRYARFEPRTLSLSTIQSVRSGKAATGEPVILLALKGSEEDPSDQRIIIFLQEPLENRKMDRDLWVRKFIELSVSDREPVEKTEITPQTAPVHEGMQPLVRRWVAPEIIRPRSDLIRTKEIVPEVKITEDEQEELPIPGQEAGAHIHESQKPPISVPEPAKIDSPVDPEPESIRRREPKTHPVVDIQSGEPDTDSHVSRSILAATQSLIAARAREELAHPATPARIRTTSSLPDMPQPVTRHDIVGETDADRAVPDRDEDLREDAVDQGIRSTSEIPDIPKEPEPATGTIEPVCGVGTWEPASDDTKTIPPATDTVSLNAGDAVQIRVAERAEPSLSQAAGPTSASIPNSLLIPAGIILVLIIAVSAFVLFQGSIPKEYGPVTYVPMDVPPVSPTVSPDLTPVSTPKVAEGVFVRISSAGGYSGKAGNPGLMQPVYGTGEITIKILDRTRPVQVSMEKTDSTGDELMIAIIKDGRIIASRSTRVPMGSLDLLIDPVTEEPPGLVTTSPTPTATRVGGPNLEYY